ncbi:hypothetical protein CPB83DRAFT_843457 [Crepidotus variabilis]|uniref:DUF4187 domain-containing protein n=1 Tax=Crepidotus variabilis TaxID=179855 RepID=A0A9P6EUJ3_9AGAR|nr:hypothetical protein CPB83DRAFT_843457 [Crepidotus variabilis]
MSDEEDDYLSDKFLASAAAASSTTSSRTYSQLRKDALKKSQLKNEENRSKSRRQLELESREAGLSKSLFERAKEEEASGLSSGNKALSIMMKMGFIPGQSLGNSGQTPEDPEDGYVSPSTVSAAVVEDKAKPSTIQNSVDDPVDPLYKADGDTSRESTPLTSHAIHKTEPLPLNEWAGRKGIGLIKGKRAHSPSASERLAKMAKMAEDTNTKHRDFRDRAREEYNNRRAEGRLGPAQLTCQTLDEKSGKSFNVLWLNPNNTNTFPAGMIEALNVYGTETILGETHKISTPDRLRQQMQQDALQPLNKEDGDGDHAGLNSKVNSSSVPQVDQFSPEILEEVVQFLRLQAQDRLYLVLSYLRDKHAYCFWCGVEYESQDDMKAQCPGSDEDDHD